MEVILDEDLRQQIVDDEHLRLLRIGYFISAGLTTVAAIFVLLYTLFLTFVFNEIAKGPGQAGIPVKFISVVGLFGVIVALLIIALAVLQFLTGQRLKQRKSRVFCLVIAGITCLSIPYGTFLGVSTFVVLFRPEVEQSFKDSSS
jgi:hypothetical protein